MPTSFLTPDQREVFGRFTGSPTPEELARHFHLDEIDLATVRQMRGATNRLGFAVLLCAVRFTGSFPACRADIPDEVITFLVEQLGDSVPENLGRYFDSSAPTYKRHTSLVRARFGYRDFHDAPGAVLGLTRKRYAFCWAGEDRPLQLIRWASDWLVVNNIILPGVSTIERLVGRIRERARLRLWHRLAQGLTESQRRQIDALFANDGVHLGGLEILRASPLKRRQSDFLRHLDRLDVLRGAGLQMTPPKGVPAAHLERLARVARRAKPSAIAALKEPRRRATVAALFYTLEACAQDDAILLLRDLAGMVIADGHIPFETWRDAVYKQLPKDSIIEAMETVENLICSTVSAKPCKELSERWRRARKLLFNIVMRIDLAARRLPKP